MKRIWAFLLAMLLVVSMTATVSAEQATLIYSYGEDAFNKVLLDIKNTVSYKGNTYIFDFRGFEFKEAFPLYGGNTFTVLEVEVPKFRLDMLNKNESLHVGTVTVDPSGKEMTLHIFSGDRTTGQYTLTEKMTTKKAYVQEVYVTPDKTDGLKPIDQVFLYSYREGAKMHYYAGSLYVSYEGYQFNSETNTVDERIAYSPETLLSIIRVLEEERNVLKNQLEGKKTSSADSSEIAELNLKIIQLEAEKAMLQEEVQKAETLAKQVELLKKEVSAKNDEIEKLNVQLAAGDYTPQQPADIAALARQIVKLEDEKNALLEKAAAADELSARISQLEKQLVEKDSVIAQLKEQLSAARNTQDPAASGTSADVTALSEQIALLTQMLTNSEKASATNAQVAQLEKEKTALQDEIDQLSSDLLAKDADIAELNTQLALLTASSTSDTAALNEQLTQLNNEKAALQSENEQIRNELEQAETLLAEKNAAIDTLNAELTSVSADAEASETTLNAQIALLNEEKALLEGNVAQLNSEIAQIESLLTEKYAAIDTLTIELEIVSANAAANEAALNKQITLLTEEKTTLQNTVDQLNAEIAQAETLIAEKNAEIDALNLQLEAAAEEAVALSAQITKLEGEKAQLLSDAAKASEQISQLQTESTLQKAQIAERDALVAQLNAELTQLKDQLAFEQQMKSINTYSDNAPQISARTEPSPAGNFAYLSESDNAVQLTGYHGSGLVVIPSKLLDMTVTAVGSSAFRGNSALTGIVFPNTLKEIGHFAFAWNSSLSGLLDLPASIEQIGNGAFKQCGFSGMIINGSFATANNNPFDLPALEFLFIREGANPALASYAFAGCEKLKVAVIPASVTLLPEGAFSGCGELTIITPAGSAAEAWAIENNFPVETATYAVYAAQYESLYPAR